MQPCAVCGGVGVDANGYCVNCRTYRGELGRSDPSDYQSDYQQVNADPYYHTSLYPAYSANTSSYQQVPPSHITGEVVDQGQNRQRHAEPDTVSPSRGRSALPLFAVLVVLLGAAAMAVVLLNRQSAEKHQLVDKCVIGAWTVTDMSMDIPTESFGTVRLTSVGGVGMIDYRADGTAVHAYGDAAGFVGEVTFGGAARKIQVKIGGSGQYDYRTSDNTMTFSNLKSNRQTTMSIEGIPTTANLAIEIGVKPARYTCTGNTLLVFSEDYRAEAHRDS